MAHAEHSRPQPAAGAEIGSLIGAAFGLILLIVNSTGFSTLGRTLVLIAGVAGFVGIVFLAMRGRGRMKQALSAAEKGPNEDMPPRANPFGRSYWIIVAVEALALFGGARLLIGFGHPELGVAWMAVVVGTHFFALGYVFKLDRFHVLAGIVTLCGIAGFIAFFASIPEFTPVFSGIIPGFVLLMFGLWALVPAGG